jgi:hypothetical protein
MHKTKLILVLAMALLASLLAVGVAPGATADPTISASAKLRNAVEPAGILVHERRLQRIANAGTDPDGDGVGTRSSGTPGYKASADYVADKLEDAGYNVRRQKFDFPYFQEFSSSFSQTAPTQRDFKRYDLSTNSGDDVMTYSGSGTVEDALVVPTRTSCPPPPPRTRWRSSSAAPATSS